MKTRTSKTFKSQNIKKTNKSIRLLGCSREFFKQWLIHQFYDDIISEIYGSLWE